MAPKKSKKGGSSRGRPSREKRTAARANQRLQHAWTDDVEESSSEEFHDDVDVPADGEAAAEAGAGTSSSSTDVAVAKSGGAVMQHSAIPQYLQFVDSGKNAAAGPGFVVIQQLMQQQQEFMSMHSNLMSQALQSMSGPLTAVLQAMGRGGLLGE